MTLIISTKNTERGLNPTVAGARVEYELGTEHVQFETLRATNKTALQILEAALLN